MSGLVRRIQKFFRELRRRNVYKVALTYIVVAFFGMQAVDLLIPATKLPGWADQFFLALLIIGFPIALVVAWAFEMSPEGIRRTKSIDGTQPAREAKKTSFTAPVLLGVTAFLILTGVGYWYWTDSGSSRSDVKERTVAVLPFQVSGSGADTWRDGMVTMLSTGLDGMAGLRAIADRTIFARWKEHTDQDNRVTKKEALAVARQIGASYAIIGSAVKLGNQLRFVADVHATESGNRLRQLEVRGPPDSVTALSNTLTRKILGVLLKRKENKLPSVDLQRLTTRSLPALKAYLEGERHYREGSFKEAITDYKQAIRRDSSFALPYVRLASAIGWVEGGYDTGEKYLNKAYKLSHRLPTRERRVVRALYLAQNKDKTIAAADSLKKLTRQYPDDPWIWYQYGELCKHNLVPFKYKEADEAFSKAIELDPGVAPYYIHYVELAMSLHHDSVLTARRLAAEPETPHSSKPLHQLARDMVFGSPKQRQQVLNRIDTMTLGDEKGYPFSGLRSSLEHPIDGNLEEKVLLRLLQRDDLPNREWRARELALNSHERGQIREAHTYLMKYKKNNPEGWQNCLMAGAISLGYPIPDSLRGQFTTLSQNKAKASPFELLCMGFYQIEQGQGEKIPGLIRQLRKNAAEEDLDKTFIQKMVAELKGYRAWKQGDLEKAATLWGKQNFFGLSGAIRRGDLFRQMGQLKKAEGWYQAAWEHPVAHERLGQLYELMDKPQKAAAAYRRFIESWKNPDPVLQDRVERARMRLRELTTTEREATEENLQIDG